MHRALTLFTSGVAIMVYSRWKKSSLGGRVGARERPWQRSELMEIELPSNFCCYVRARCAFVRMRVRAPVIASVYSSGEAPPIVC